MRIAIVGHGPSLLEHKCGPVIDAHDTVIRIKRSWELPRRLPMHYGMRTDIACGSLKILAAMRVGWGPQIPLWTFVDTRTEDVPQHYPAVYGAICDRELCLKWMRRYREIRSPMVLDDKQETKGSLSDDHGHLHPSAGFYTILYALELLGGEISLYGFDSLLSGRFDWSITRGPDYDEYPDHNWPTESRLVREAVAEYGGTLEGNTIRMDQCSVNT